jgi:hypothetical protein
VGQLGRRREVGGGGGDWLELRGKGEVGGWGGQETMMTGRDSENWARIAVHTCNQSEREIERVRERGRERVGWGGWERERESCRMACGMNHAIILFHLTGSNTNSSH